MIPEFPIFKTLELADQADVEKFTSKFPPSSDFNFAGTWSWDIRNKMQISQLNNNYVIRFVSYLTGEPFYTFLGTNKINETIEELLINSIKEGMEPAIKLIPEYCNVGINTKRFRVEEDRDNFDYIYDLEEQRSLPGKKFSKKRNHVSTFLREHPTARATILDLANEKIQEECIALFHKWALGKFAKDENFELHEEIIVIEKLFMAVDKFNLVGVGVYIENQLAAFCINELTDSEYVMAHIAKANVFIPGVSAFLMHKTADLLTGYNKRYMNYEQDLGVEALRQAKERFRPAFYLKKYSLTFM